MKDKSWARCNLDLRLPRLYVYVEGVRRLFGPYNLGAIRGGARKFRQVGWIFHRLIGLFSVCTNLSMYNIMGPH
jgi:hypothetical protein